MRNPSYLVASIVFALAGTASAKAPAPAEAKAAPPAGDAAAVTAPPPAPVDVKPGPTTSDVVTTPLPAEPAPAKKKFEVGLAFLPMGLGRYTSSLDTQRKATTDASFAYGVGLSVSYEVLPHLVVGVAPQAIFNVEEKVPVVFVEGTTAARQYDLLARVAGVLDVGEATTVYAEVLPGYSIITSDAKPKGPVLAFGLGVAMNLTDRFFINVGGGYQIGFQKWAEGANTYTTSTRFVRVALGGGVRF